MKNVKAVIWDWNGTLLDDVQLGFSINNRMLAARGLPLIASLEDYRRSFKMPIIGWYRELGYRFPANEAASPAAGEEAYPKVAAEYHRYYLAECDACPLCPFAEEVLRALRQSSVMQILLSVTEQNRLEEQVASKDILSLFDRVIGQNTDLSYGKKQTAEALLRELSLSPREVLFVGDTLHDAEIASALGSPCVLFSGGHQSAAVLASTGFPVTETLKELLPMVFDDEKGAVMKQQNPEAKAAAEPIPPQETPAEQKAGKETVVRVVAYEEDYDEEYEVWCGGEC